MDIINANTLFLVLFIFHIKKTITPKNTESAKRPNINNKLLDISVRSDTLL